MEQTIAQQLNNIESAEDADQLDALQIIIDSIGPEDFTAEVIVALLGVFERFPESDGYGVFWSILHALEACDGYIPFLVASVKRMPVDFNVLMINRLINGGIIHNEDVEFLTLLQSVSTNDAATESAKISAENFVEFQLEGGLDA